VIEQIVYFLLGLSTAGLVALAIVPALWARAYRLSRKHVEENLPLNRAEIAAERDQLRAGFAVEQRQLEQAIDRARAEAHAARLAHGTKVSELAAAHASIADRDATIVKLEASIADLRERLAARVSEVDEARQLIALQKADLETATTAKLGLDDEHRALNAVADERRLEIAALRTQVEARDARLSEQKRELETAKAEARGKTEALRQRERELREATTELAILTRKLEAAEHLAEKRAELLSAADQRLAAAEAEAETLAKARKNEQRTHDQETRRIAALEKQLAERDAAIDTVRQQAAITAADLARTIERLKEDNAALKAATGRQRGAVRPRAEAIETADAVTVADRPPKS
jgi:DNA repair exonuclease SbcCD ATPase subunit